jgi:hypothetical protein
MRRGTNHRDTEKTKTERLFFKTLLSSVFSVSLCLCGLPELHTHSRIFAFSSGGSLLSSTFRTSLGW